MTLQHNTVSLISFWSTTCAWIRVTFRLISLNTLQCLQFQSEYICVNFEKQICQIISIIYLTKNFKEKKSYWGRIQTWQPPEYYFSCKLLSFYNDNIYFFLALQFVSITIDTFYFQHQTNSLFKQHRYTEGIHI